ncbi:hypothetical protein KUTeg_011689 [Tegillarca granosa]|uniref:Uncharacterized protein n=1 Tax=Tegillarca granosa TaxID=220873 RepID=A0ABQ9EXM7_TEGGR|nr:hypothetical protein KUTeg_011689 [Tegillarca granosa]
MNVVRFIRALRKHYEENEKKHLNCNTVSELKKTMVAHNFDTEYLYGKHMDIQSYENKMPCFIFALAFDPRKMFGSESKENEQYFGSEFFLLKKIFDCMTCVLLFC